MNLRSALNNGFLFLAIGATFIGLTKADDSKLSSVAFWAFLIFFVFFRIKMWLDDAHHFHTVKTNTGKEKWLFRVGVVVAIVAWSLWAMAGYSIANLGVSYFYVLLSIALLTVWVIIAAISKKGFGENGKLWLLFNFIYMAVIALIICSNCNLPLDKNWLIGILVLGTVIDFLFSNSLDHFKE
jgi:hypothetical protein